MSKGQLSFVPLRVGCHARRHPQPAPGGTMKLPLALATGLALAACRREPALPQTRNVAAPQEAQPAVTEKGTTQEVPVTSSSPEARTEFLRGRDLADNIHFEEATAALQKAVELDPRFAT